MRIERVTDPAEIHRGADLYDAPPTAEATAAFLEKTDHHVLYAYDANGEPIGMVSGVETTHPDKGTEMFLYELSVADTARRQGVGAALVHRLAELARANGCYGMWVGVDLDNAAALATYRRAGAVDQGTFAMLGWTFGAAESPSWIPELTTRADYPDRAAVFGATPVDDRMISFTVKRGATLVGFRI